MNRRRTAVIWAPLALSAALFAQGNSEEARLRQLNAETLRLRGLLQAATPGQAAQLRAQGAELLAQRQPLLESLIASSPSAALELAFAADTIADLAAAFPQGAARLESRGTWQGQLLYYIEDGVVLSSHKEVRKLKSGSDLIDLHSVNELAAGTKCNDVIAASGVKSGNRIVAESSTLVTEAAVACTPIGAQKIAVILVRFPSTALPPGITQDFLNGVYLGNAFTNNDVTPDRSVSDFWTQNSDGKTWVNSTGAGSLTVVGPYTLSQDFAYCTYNSSTNSYSDNSGALRQAAYAAANADLNYADYSRVAIVVPHNNTCNGIAGVASIGCWGSECPGDGTCNVSWTWLRADQIGSRSSGIMLITHEMGHNLGMSHAGSRYHAGVVVGPVGTAGTRSEYGDRFGTMGNWNFGYYNAPHSLNQIGWLTSAANVQTVTTNGVYTIQPYDARPGGVKVLKIQRGTGNTNAWLYVTHYPRNPNYLDQLGSQISTGALIHYQDTATPGGKTDLLDFTPSTANNFGDPALLEGQTWVDAYTDLSLTVNSVVNGNLTMTVTYSTPPCTQAAPTVTIAPLSQSVAAGSPKSYTVSVTNNDSIACSSRSFPLSSSLPSDSGWGSTFSPSSLTLAPGATGSSTLTKTPPLTALGTYTVNASAGGSTTNPNASLDVTTPPPAPPAAPTNLTATPQYSGSGRNKALQQVRVAWTDVATETYYELARCKVSGKGKNITCTYGASINIAANATFYNDPASALSGAGTYKYRLRSGNANGTSAWVEVQAQVQ
jgi:M6 family metalloprotease-like protein